MVIVHHYQDIKRKPASQEAQERHGHNMNSVNFMQQARHALIPMRKATIDALLLTAFILIGFLVFPDVLLSYPWLFLPVYALAYLLTVVLRLRQAARVTTEVKSPYNYLYH
jgi:hypothetical protein